ncbi:MAG: glycosyltransferase family 4 protein [Bacteroidales bacterium]|nr:glycosyltransferase family 4 protein [Candidatus Latescibacterota bacterium]
MRILMVQTYHYYRGGDSTCMFNLTSLLEQEGHEVVPFAMQHPQNLESPYSEHFSSEIDFPKMLEEFSVGTALSVVSKSIYNREAKARISRLIDEVKPDIAHFHNIHGHLTTSIMGPLRRKKIPIVWTLHDYRLVCPNTTFLRGGEICEKCLPRKYHHVLLGKCKKGSRAASLVAMMTTVFDRVSRVPARTSRFITPSAFLKGKLVEGRIDPAKISVIPNFVDVQSFNTGREEDYFLYFGRISHEKGIDLLIEAVSEMKVGRLKVVGEGPSSEELKKLVKQTGAPVEFLGFRSGDELRSLLEGAMFVVVPSTWYENLPFSVMEALAAGKPVIATDIGGIPEMVEDEGNGLLFPLGDVAALKGCLARLIEDGELRRAMSVACRKKAELLYNRDWHYDQIMKVYTELTGK